MTISWHQMLETMKDGHVNWRDLLDERQQKQVEWSQLYAKDYHHGDEGHNSKLIIAKMADMLDSMSRSIKIDVPKE